MIRNVIGSLVDSIGMTLALIVGLTLDLMYFVFPNAVRRMFDRLIEWADDYGEVYQIDENDEQGTDGKD